ncbi:TMV resistance protein N-like isoform X3 [Prunus avium]|uniref:ADP-ribosyl cyclase/cyclic ADP-ribose hydrolase n=1 Tax=Prunus avium TaxID=42229 RepID=A0A6P5TVS4_PRUAV|nr:TMV resistance protein N-like isoform X3 [Prunus avium]
MSNPKSPNHRCTYDAFLSFRGTDTRKGFTDHLYRALEVAGIHTFRDDDEIERGANISAELQKAIQESRVSIIVFSKDYASSRWCLDELVTIMDRRETTEHMVMPIFYDVDPSHVRNQTGIFEEAFARHQQCFNKEMDKVEKWRKALGDVADLGGMVLGDRSESQFIQEIVEVIGNKLDHTWNRRLRVNPHVVGIDCRVKGLNMWLEDGSTDVGVAVVYGMGGIGKTTIAKTAYNQNFNKFQGSRFLADIRATSILPNGLVHLQRNLLSDLQKGKAKKIYSLDEGITKIERAIRCKRVLIALDDVDNLEQFNAILGMREWLHPGSKIIITTRHEHLLKAHENCAIFEVEGLHEYESLELFSWHAFGQPHPGEGYMDFSRPVVQHCGGVPLALQVLGSSLFGKAADVWKNALQNLDVITEGKIQKILRISLDSLQDHDKRLFLHIACFFIGKDKDFSTTVLDECEFATNIGIQNLVDRCLLIIDGLNKLTMHQLLQDMGRGIIREESPEDPGKRTRVWNKDASNVLRKLTGTETIKGLMLNIPMLIKDESSKIISSGSNRKRFHVEDYDGNCSSSRRRLGFFSWQSISFSSTNSFPVSNETGFKTEGFRRMHNLELLLLDNVKISGGYEDFPKNLIWLSWRGFALKSIPTNFYLERLIALNLRNSSLQHVWKGTRFLPRLKILNLSHSHGLVTTPDLSGFPNLERLILKGCINLKEVDESIGDLEKLVFLNLKDCKNLMKLPIRISMPRSLQKLILSGCSNLVLPASMILKNQSDSTPTDMKKLSLLFAVKSWQSIRSWVLPRKNLQLTSASLPQFLKSLDMAYCNLSEIPNDLSSLSSLEYLDLSGNPFLSLSVNMNGLSKLQTILLEGCTNLEMIPELPPSVEILRAWYCTSLKRVLLNLPDMLKTIRRAVLICENLVEIQNVFKMRPLRSVDIEMIKDIGLFNLESIGSTDVEMLNCLTGTTRKGPLQGLDECGIFSIFLHGSEVPDWFCHKSSMGNSELSITIPPHRNLKIRGLNACVVYAQGKVRDERLIYLGVPVLRISNETKGLKWSYVPVTIGFPKEKEHMLWLSHWRFANDELEGGDEIRVSVDKIRSSVRIEFDTKEFGIQVVYEQNNNEGSVTEDITTMFQHETTTPLIQNQVIAGDVSALASRFHKNYTNKVGEYFICNHNELSYFWSQLRPTRVT